MQKEKLTEENIDILNMIYDDLGIIDEARVISELEGRVESLNLENIQLEEFRKEALKSLEDKELLLKERDSLRKAIDAAPPQKTIVFCENLNADDLNALNLLNVTFIQSQSKIYAFDAAKSKSNPIYALIDRDFLTDEEKIYIEENTNVRLFDYYCFENYLYHPENLDEYYRSVSKEFDAI
jgi:hypothetical protein